jgi:hypothetical protein
MKPIPPLEMGSTTFRCTKGASRNSKKLGPKSLLKTYMRVELKKTSWCGSSRVARKHKAKKKVLK